MIRSLLLAFFAAAAVIAGQVGARQAVVFNQQRAAAAAVARATETRKTHEINVPRIKDGAVKGYAVMLLSYAIDLGALKKATIAPDSILIDEAFRYVYNDDTIDFDHLDRFDVAKMCKALIRSVNARVNAEVLVDVGVQEFSYAGLGDTHARP
jgi:hypothetical protein